MLLPIDKNTMKKYLVLLILFTNAKILSAQIAISYFPFQSIFSVATNTEKHFFLDSKVETNGFISNLNMEFSPKFNFIRKESVNYYAGTGLSINPANLFANLPITNGYFVDLGVRAKPWKTVHQFQVVFEISPYVNTEFRSGNLRTRLGIGWNFEKRKRV